MLSVLVTYGAALILLLQTSAGTPSKVDNKVPPPCTVSGRVVTAAEGTPLKSARVVLMREQEAREPQLYAATSDSDGRFTIKDVPAARYKFFAARSGYVQQEYQASPGEHGAMLALKAGQEVKDALFRLTLAAVITGRINDEDGEPMQGIQVVALRRPTEEEREDSERFNQRPQELSAAAAAQTDDRGQYRMFGLRPGEYYIKATDDYQPLGLVGDITDWAQHQALGAQYASVYYPGVTQQGQAQAVSLTPGEEAPVDFIMRRRKTAQVSGRVIGVDGKPATNAFLYLEESPAPDYGTTLDVQTDGKGEFTFRGVAPGSYVVHARERASWEEEVHRATQKIEVGTENLDSIVLVLGRGIKLDGRIEGLGSEALNSRLHVGLDTVQGGEFGAWTRVKTDGTFQMLDVPEGTYTFSMYGLEEGWYIKSVRAGADDILANGLVVDKGDNGGTIRVVVSRGGAQLEGSVTQDDKPLVAARVRVTPDPETPFNRSRARSTTTDQVGRYSFTGLPPGQYRVLAKSSATGNGVVAASQAQRVTLAQHDHREIPLTVETPQGSDNLLK
jgi:protocatechuate 3,4-dioxygenase beta subunit